MKIRIYFSNSDLEVESQELEQIANAIQNEGISKIERITLPNNKEKGSELLVGIAILDIAISTIGILFDFLSYLKNAKPRYSMSFHIGEKQFSIENLEYQEFEKYVQAAKLEKQNEVHIQIATN